jgi:hypothetical protein
VTPKRETSSWREYLEISDEDRECTGGRGRGVEGEEEEEEAEGEGTGGEAVEAQGGKWADGGGTCRPCLSRSCSSNRNCDSWR